MTASPFRNSTDANLSRFQDLGIVERHGVIVGVRDDGTQLATTPRDRFLQAAEKELVAFERREREFLKRDREELAAKLQIPLDQIAAPN